MGGDMDVLKDMLDTAQAHEQWAMSCEATSSEAATCTVFAAQIRDWVDRLRASPAGHLSPEAPVDPQPGGWQLRLAFEAGFQWCANGTDKCGDYNGGSIENGFRKWWTSRAAGHPSPEAQKDDA